MAALQAVQRDADAAKAVLRARRQARRGAGAVAGRAAAAAAATAAAAPGGDPHSGGGGGSVGGVPTAFWAALQSALAHQLGCLLPTPPPPSPPVPLAFSASAGAQQRSLRAGPGHSGADAERAVGEEPPSFHAPSKDGHPSAAPGARKGGGGPLSVSGRALAQALEALCSMGEQLMRLWSRCIAQGMPCDLSRKMCVCVCVCCLLAFASVLTLGAVLYSEGLDQVFEPTGTRAPKRTSKS